jgi:hypothetical protein
VLVKMPWQLILNQDRQSQHNQRPQDDINEKTTFN